MQDYTMRCWDDDAPGLEQAALSFPDEREAMFAALELADKYQKVELWRGETLIAYLAPQMAMPVLGKRLVH